MEIFPSLFNYVCWRATISIFFQFTGNLERERSQEAFQRLAQNRFFSVQKSLEFHLQILDATKALFDASNLVTRSEFKIFTQPLMQQYPNIQALEWIPRVVQANRTIFRRQAQVDGFSTFEIRKKDAQGSMVPSEEKPEYFPVYYVEPYQGNEIALGFDLSSSSTRLSTLVEAGRSGHMLATARITLVQEKKKQFAFLVFNPIYRKEADITTPETRWSGLMGFALGVFRLGDLVSSSNEVENYLHLQLLDFSAIEDKQLLYISNFSPGNSRFKFIKEFKVGGRIWEIQIKPTLRLQQQTPSWQPWFILFISLSLTLLLSGSSFILMTRSRRVEEMVKVRTQELAISENKTRAIVDASLNGIITIDIQGKIDLFNPAAERIFGYTKEEIQGKNITQLIPESHRQAHEKGLEKYRKTGRGEILGLSFEMPGLHKQGNSIPLSLAISEMTVMGDAEFVGNLMDITERKKTERDLKLFRNLLDYSRDSIFIILPKDGQILDCNRQACESLGYYREELLQLGIKNIELKMNNGGAWEEVVREIKKHGTLSIEGEYSRKDRVVFPVEVSVSYIQQEDSEYILALARNTTEQLKVRQALIDAKNQAEVASRMKSEFLNTMSHELRTPLTVMLGNIDLFLDLEELPEPEETVEIAEDIDRAGQHLLTLINDLLDLSKIEAGKLALYPESFDVSELIEEILLSIKKLGDDKGLQLQMQCLPAQVLADPVRLKQILFNLLSNAVKFTEKGSICISTRKVGRELEFCVADEGCGIRTEDLTLIFDPFRQIDGSLTRKVGGTGLGLAITKRLVEMHQGEIWVTSQVDQGSKFFFSIPLSEKDSHGKNSNH